VTRPVVYASVLSVVLGLSKCRTRIWEHVQRVGALPGSGTSAHRLVELLYNASGQYSWLMVVSGHCVLDVRLSSVIVCWLMAIWMNVVHAVVAHWLFFFAGPLPIPCA